MGRTNRTATGRALRTFIAGTALVAHGAAFATEFYYNGVVTVCSGTCAGVDSLDVDSFMIGALSIDVAPGESFTFADVSPIGDQIPILNPALPAVPYDGSNWATANPFPLTAETAVPRESAAGITTGGDYTSGIVLFELVGMLQGSDAWMIFDLSSGEARICVFFTTAGCIPNATEVALISGRFFADADSDSYLDDEDNCTTVPNGQDDTDIDGFGNRCDPDLNNDCVVNAADLGLLKAVFFSADPDADFNGDGAVNTADLAVLKAAFFGPPGPSLVPNVCAPVSIALETFGDGGVPDAGGWNAGTGNVVADAGDNGSGDHALMYTATPPQAGFHVVHPAGGATPNPDFLGNFRFNYATDVVFRARHSGVGDPVVLRAVLFRTVNALNWAQTAAAVTIPTTATQWQTYRLSIRPADLVTGGQDGLSWYQIQLFVERISLRHDPLGTGPLTYSPVSQVTTVFFDDIDLSAQGGIGPF